MEIEERIKDIEKDLEKQRKRKEPYVESLIKNFDTTNETAKQIVDCSCIFAKKEVYANKLSVQEFLKTTKEYSVLFGSIEKLCRFLEAQQMIQTSMDIVFRKKTIFHFKSSLIKERIENLECLFDVPRDGCIEMLIEHPDWLYHKKEYMNKRFEILGAFWGLNKEEVAKQCLCNPFFLGKRIDRLQEKIELLTEHFDVRPTLIKKLFLKHSWVMNIGVKFFVENKITRDVFEKPWLLECYNGYQGCSYGGYRTFKNLTILIEYIERNFGKIVKFIKQTYKDGEFLGVVTKKDDDYYLVSIGADYILTRAKMNATTPTTTEKLLTRIFGDEIVRVEENQEYDRIHKEIFVKIKSPEFEGFNDLIKIVVTVSFTDGRDGIVLKRAAPEQSILSSSYIINDYINNISPLRVEENCLNVDFYGVQFLNGEINFIKQKEPEDFLEYFECLENSENEDASWIFDDEMQ